METKKYETKKFFLDYIFSYPEFRNKKYYFEGIDLGGYWNGACRPAFPKEEADRIVRMINRTAYLDKYRYNADNDQEMWFEIHNDGNCYTERCEEGIYMRYGEIIVDGKPYYLIGTDCWTWSEFEYHRAWYYDKIFAK